MAERQHTMIEDAGKFERRSESGSNYLYHSQVIETALVHTVVASVKRLEE